ncbi:MAG: T9SS type A sorting domain-containing protein [Ignavibacteria bacterium]|nr:T9SS type A sorting domain-containing protein [Ignavibacteria bacterium]
MFVEAWANAWPDPSRPGATDIIRDTCKIVSVTKAPTRFDILRAGQEYVVSRAGRFPGTGTPEARTIDLSAPRISLPAGSDRIKEEGHYEAVSVDHILLNQAYRRNVSDASVGKYLVVNNDNVPLDRAGNPLYLDAEAMQINPAFARDPVSNLPVFQKLDAYNSQEIYATPYSRYNQLNDDMRAKLGYTIPGARIDARGEFFDITIAGGGAVVNPLGVNTAYGTLMPECLGWHIVTDHSSGVQRAVNMRPVLLRATPVWENTPPTGGNPYGPAMFTGSNAQPGQTLAYEHRLYADSVYTYVNAAFGGQKNNSVRGELMGTFTDRGRPGSYASQSNGEFDRVTRIGASGWRAEDFTIAGLNGMSRTKNAIGVWGGMDNNGGLWSGDFARRVLVVSGGFGISSGPLPIAPGVFIRLVDSTAEQVIDLRIVDPTLTDMAGEVVDDNASYDHGKYTVVRKAQRIANNVWHLDDTYWRGGEGVEDGIQGPNATARLFDEQPFPNRGVPWLKPAYPEPSIGRYYFWNTSAHYLQHTFVVVPYRIAYLSIFPSSFDASQGNRDNTRLPMGILPVQADIDTLPRVALGYYNDGSHDLGNFEMYTRLYGQIRHGATDQIPNNANTPYARPDTVFRDVRYVYSVTPYDRYGNMNTRDTLFVQISSRYTDWWFTNLEPSGTLIIRSGGNWFSARPMNTPDGPDNTNLREDTLRIFNNFGQSSLRNEYVGIKPDDRRLTLAVGDPGGANIPHGLLPANVISSRPVWVKQAFAPAPFLLGNAASPNRTLFRLDHTGACAGNGIARDTLRLQWQASTWNASGKNNVNDTVKYAWCGIIDSVGLSTSQRLTVSVASDDNGVTPSLTIAGDKLRALLFRPGVPPQPNADSLVMRVRWFVKATNKAGQSVCSDTAGVTVRNSPPPTAALIVSINRPPENAPTAVQPAQNATISGISAATPPIDVIWTAARDRNIEKGTLIGGFTVFDVASQSWKDDPSGRTVDTLGYQWVGKVLRTFPATKGAPRGTLLVKNTGATTGTQLSQSDLDALFGGFSADPLGTSADSVILDWTVYAKDFHWTDNLPIEEVSFRYNSDGTLRSDTATWSRFGCRPHEIGGSWFRLALTKLDRGGVEITRDESDPDSARTTRVHAVFTGLSQNYPNPFNPVTTISYSLQAPARVTLAVFDLLGTPVKTLVNESKDAGAYQVSWDATDDLGRKLPSGSYMLKLTAGDFSQTRMMTLLK